jgi:trimeric autotransporter adhesin
MHTRPVRPAIGVAALIVLVLAQACGSGGDNSPTGGGGLSKIAMSPSLDTIELGDTITISAQPQTGNGSPVSGLTLFWSSSAQSVATVTQSGKVTAIDSGTATIAASVNGISGQSTIVVMPKSVASITVAPASASLFINQSVQLTATLKDSSGKVLTGRTVAWSSSNAAAASVDQSGFVLGLANGTTTISAKSGNATGTATITVSNVPVKTITISPASPSVIVGQTTTLTATAKDSAGNVLTGRTITWASSNTNVATITNAGVATGVAVGTSSITASSGSATSPAVTLTVNPIPASSVVVSPSVANIFVGGTTALSATVTDANGNPISGASVTWSSGNAAVATVASTGALTATATGTGAGTAVITAKSTSSSASGAAAVNVSLVPIKTITVTPSPDTVLEGGTVQMTATAQDSAGNVLTGRTITWTSSNTTFATVSATGLVTTANPTNQTANRTITITASSPGSSVQGVASVVIRPVGVATVTVAPATDTVVQGASRTLTATVVDSEGRTVARTVTWSSSNGSVAVVSSTGAQTASVTGGASTGTATITAAVGTITGTNTTVVTQAATTGVTVSLQPANDTLVINATGGQASATTTPAGGTVTWTSSNTSVATINATTGAITGVGFGQTTITATATNGGATGSAVLNVVVNAVTVTPNPINVQVNGTQPATATATDANGNPVNGITFTWATASNTIATVSGSGVVTGQSVGSTTLTATGGGRASTAVPVNVTQPPPASVTLAPTTATIFATAPNNTATFTPTVRDANNNILTGVTLTWASSSGVASVVGGVVTASNSAVGPTTITATTANNVVGSASVTVIGHVGAVILAPAAGQTTLSFSGTGNPTSEQVSATVTDTFGNVVTPTETLTWASSDPTNAPVTPTGTLPASTAVTVTASGSVTETVTITATATDGSIQGTTTINITP